MEHLTKRLAACSIGEGSTIEISNTQDPLLAKIGVTCGRSSKIVIHGIDVLNSLLDIYLADHCELTIGPGQLINGAVHIYQHEPSRVVIGERCLFGDVNIWSSDMHSIIDVGSRERINPARDVSIGARVWLGDDALVLKGSSIANDCVVSARAVVTEGAYPPNCILAGVPARVVRTGIAWDSRLR
jgi:acetyltransferase-like isoleucine patch superfamily enzyme